MTSTTSESIGLSGGLRVLASAIGETSRVRCEYIARRHGVTTAAAVQIDRLSRGARWCHDQGRLMDGMVERIGVFALVGLGSGFVSGLFGVGGGIVRIPLFVYLLPLFGVAHSVMMHVAVGTSMALGNLDLAFFRTWAVGILIGVLVGTALLPYASTERLQVIFAIFMVTVGVYEGFLKDRLVFARTPPQGAKKVGVASAIGCLAALTG